MSETSLLERLRDLALVDVDALLAGTSGATRDALLAAHVADLEDALGRARAAIEKMSSGLRGGAEPLAFVDWPEERRASDDGEQAARRSAEALVERAALCRELAVLAEITAGVLPRLVAADRRGT